MVNLMDQLPQFYRNSLEMTAMQSYLQLLLADLWRNRDEFSEQLCIDTATWGLRAWEQALGIVPDETKDIGFRRDRIKAKLRGAGTTTKEHVQAVASTFSNGEVDVIEISSKYQVIIKFTGTFGLPPNLDDLTQTLREIMPAHLQWVYEIVYNTWASVGRVTWGELAGHTWLGAKEDNLS